MTEVGNPPSSGSPVFYVGLSQSLCVPCVEDADRMCVSEPGAAHGPECDYRETEVPIRTASKAAIRGVADPAGGLLVSALSAQLP
jgi:hypothetical protein